MFSFIIAERGWMNMSKRFGIEIKKARKDAGMTQERAAEALNVSVRTYAKYESGEILPGDDMVAGMMQVFKNTCLGYAYLSKESAVGRMIMPKIGKLPGVAAGAMQYHVALADANSDCIRLERICCDDKITMAEERDLSPIVEKIFDLAGKGLTLYLTCPKRTQKKEPLGGNRTALMREVNKKDKSTDIVARSEESRNREATTWEIK